MGHPRAAHGRSSAALVRGRRLAVDYSPDGAIPYLDGIPAGVAELLRGLGATLVPSAELVTRYCSVWTAEDVASHRRAAEAIAAIAREALALAGAQARTGEPMNEHALAVWVRERFDRAGLVTESGPSVSWGPNAARAHYDPTAAESAPIVPRGAAAAGPLGHGAGRDLRRPDVDGGHRRAVRAGRTALDRGARARDAALDLIGRRVRARRARAWRGRGRGGARSDRRGGLSRLHDRADGAFDRPIRAARVRAADRRHRDLRRPAADSGVGFSVEPGVYLPGETGVRSEVNVVVGEGDILVTPREYQTELLVV